MKEIATNVFIETGYPSVTVGAIITDEGVICVDSPSHPADAQDWINRLRNKSGLPIRYLILTDYHMDRIYSAHLFRTRIVTQEAARAKLRSYKPRIPASVLDSFALRYGLTRKELNNIPVVNPQISFCEKATILLGGRKITVMHVPSATHGSLWVRLEKEQLVFTGDTLVIDQHPPLAEADSKSWLDTLVHLRRERFRVKTIVPGRGSLCEKSASEPISDYVRLARRRVLKLFRAGRPRADTTSLIPEFLPAFSAAAAPKEWLQKQIKMGLDHIYDEYKIEKRLSERAS